jgi:hypothetical protein
MLMMIRHLLGEIWGLVSWAFYLDLERTREHLAYFLNIAETESVI